MIPNKLQTSCSICQSALSAGRGFVFKDAKERWTSVCTSYQCVKSACPENLPKYYKLVEAEENKRITKDGIVLASYDESTLKVIQAMPGAKYEKSLRKWRVSTKVGDRERVIELAKKIGMPLDDELLVIETSAETKKALIRAKDKGLYPYQLEAVKWLCEQENCLLAFDMGLGKTPTTLMSMDRGCGHLVVAPSHLKLNWKDEAAKWRPDLQVSVTKGKKDFRLPDVGEIVITTYTSLPDWLNPPAGKRKSPDITEEIEEAAKNVVVVYDEVHALKNNKTKQSRKCKQITKIAKKTIGLTGTPIMNRQLELWNICTALGIDKTIFGSFPNFLRLFRGTAGRFGYEFGKPLPEVAEHLRKAMLRKTQKEVAIQLPSKIYKEISVETPRAIARTLDNAWDLYQKSSYFESGELPDITEMSKVKAELAASKIPALEELVGDLEESGICPIVFSAHREPVIVLGQRPGWKTILGGMTPEEKHEIKNLYQEGKLNGLAATIQSAGTGLTLTYGNHVVFNDLDWVPANNMQAEDRVARIGQAQENCFYYHMIADHPIDRHIHRLLLEKMSLARDVLEGEIKIEQVDVVKETEEKFEERKQDIEEENRRMCAETIRELLPIWMQDLGVEDQDVDLDAVRSRASMVAFDAPEDRIARLLLFTGIFGKEEALLMNELIRRKNV